MLMESHSLPWKLAAWYLIVEWHCVSLSSLSKNLSCISYGSSVPIEGLEHLQGLILEIGQNGTIQCPYTQCCFGIWNLTQGHLQATFQGCWISGKKACDSPACESRSGKDAKGVMLSCRCNSHLCNANIIHDGRGEAHAELFPGSRQTIWIIASCLFLFLLGCLAFLVLRQQKIPAVLHLSSEEAGELTEITTGPKSKFERKLPRHELPDLQFLQGSVHPRSSFSHKIWRPRIIQRN